MTEKPQAREYYGKADAEPLMEWLNRIASRENDTARMGMARVQGVIETILRLQDKAETMIAKGGWEHKPKKFRSEELALNSTLQQYEFVFGLDFSKREPMVWTLCGTEDPASNEHLPRETIAVLHIVELAKQGLLNKVRRCDCGKYFFARLPAQRFHSAACRIQFWETSPERKKRRREKAREYYHLHKSGKVR